MSEETLDDVISQPETPKEAPKEPEPVTEAKEPETAPEPEVQPEPKVQKSESSSDDIVKGLTAELSRIREQNRQLKAQEPKPEPTNIWEDPEKRLQELSSDFESKLHNTKLMLSENYARKVYEDYDETLDVFMKMVDGNPILAAQMNQAQDPATFAYETAKQKLTLEKVGDISQYEKTVLEDAERKAEEKYKKLYAEKFGKELPTSLADTRAAADNTSVVDDTLDDVIGVDARHRW